MMELARLEFRCRWAQALPLGHIGRALNAWFCGALARYGAPLVDALHKVAGRRPFALALVDESPAPWLRAGRRARIAPLLIPSSLRPAPSAITHLPGAVGATARRACQSGVRRTSST